MKRANIAQGTYYLYFPSKLSVMPDIAAVFVDHLMVELNKNVTASSFKQQLNELVDTVFHTTEHHKKTCCSHLLWFNAVGAFTAMGNHLYPTIRLACRSFRASKAIRWNKKIFTLRRYGTDYGRNNRINSRTALSL